MRRRYVIIGGDLVDVTDAPQAPLRADAGALWGDSSYKDLRATDGTPVDTRTKHREYMKQRGLTTADDYTQQWQRDAKQREAFYTHAPDPQRAHDIARAWDKHRG